MFSRLPVVLKLPEKSEKAETATRKTNTSSRLGTRAKAFILTLAIDCLFGHPNNSVATANRATLPKMTRIQAEKVTNADRPESTPRFPSWR